jgi:hypothetical protein
MSLLLFSLACNKKQQQFILALAHIFPVFFFTLLLCRNHAVSVHRYAAFMFFVYCIGVPLGSYFLLRAYKKPIQRLQANEFSISELEGERRSLIGYLENSMTGQALLLGLGQTPGLGSPTGAEEVDDDDDNAFGGDLLNRQDSIKSDTSESNKAPRLREMSRKESKRYEKRMLQHKRKSNTAQLKDIRKAVGKHERLQELDSELGQRFKAKDKFLLDHHMLKGLSPLYRDYEPEYWY